MERQYHLSITALLLLIGLFSSCSNALGDPIHQPTLRANDDIGGRQSDSVEGEVEQLNHRSHLRRKSRALKRTIQDSFVSTSYFEEEADAVHRQEDREQPLDTSRVEVGKNNVSNPAYVNSDANEHLSRSLSANSATIGTFYPLDCNPVSWSSCDTLVSENLPPSLEPLVIPCGQCYTFDITGDVTFSGINIKGKLLFPVNHKANIYTTYVIVQGELEIKVDHAKVTPDNLATKFILTGTNNVYFTPTDAPNVNACAQQTNNQCDLGPKPFVIVGGKVNIVGMPESCTTFTPVVKQIHKDPTYLCEELIINGDVENSFDPYPMQKYIPRESLVVIEEDGNKFLRLTGRIDSRSSVLYKFPDNNCFTLGLEYTFSARIRLGHSPGFVGGSETYYWYFNYKKADGSWGVDNIANCAAQSLEDGWVTCSSEVIIYEALVTAQDVYLLMAINNGRDGAKYEIDYDDITIRYKKGYVDELVTSSSDVSCWGDNADVHVTSATYYNNPLGDKSNGSVSQIKSMIDNGDGTATIKLNEAFALPLISQEEDTDYAVEIALLSRNVIIQGEAGEIQKGGYMQVLHTPSVGQTIQGIEFLNMGRIREYDRFALQFLYSGNVESTLVSRNSFRNSNQRCVVIEGTSNVTISHNIGYQTNGHCIYIGYQSESNLIAYNLASDTRSVAGWQQLWGETDGTCAAFLNWYHPNDYTQNIAVAGNGYGFLFENNSQTRLENYSWINESVRNLISGVFSNNAAKSNYGDGLRFRNFESGETVLAKVKAIKNRSHGLAFYTSYNASISGIFADNTQIAIDLQSSDNIHFHDTVVRGVTSETKTLVQSPFFMRPCVSAGFESPIGLKIPTAIYKWDLSDNIGTTLTNVVFSDFDHSDECETSIPISFFSSDSDNNIDHFNYLTMFTNVTFKGSKLVDALSPDKDGVKDIVIHDIDGQSDPLGMATKGMLVSNVNWLKAFAGGSCQKYPHGVSYCDDSCYRTVNLMVDQTESDLAVRVTRLSDGENTIFPHTFKWDDDLQFKHYSERFRFFPLSLPEGSFKVEFLKDFQPIWPRFVLQRWEGVPSCEGFLSPSNIELVEPPFSCENLIVNGDMELGIDYWYHSNGGTVDRGGLMSVDGVGIDNSIALRLFNRFDVYSGVGQNIETRCLRENLNEYYEIELYYRLEQGTTPIICNPYSGNWADRCPTISFLKQKHVGENIESTASSEHARVVIPNNLGDFNLLHGVFKIDESLQSLDRLYISVAMAPRKYDMIIDNFTIKKLPGICEGDLVRNGNFESNGKYWSNYLQGAIDIDMSSNKSLKVSKPRSFDGAFQYLYIDKNCLKVNDRYLVTGKFRIERATDGTRYECEIGVFGTELDCSDILLLINSSSGSESSRPATTVYSYADLYQGWSVMAGIMIVTERQLVHDSMIFILYNTHPNMNVFYDDISMVPMPRSCDNLVLNNDFEVGDSRFWFPSFPRYLTAEISNIGAEGSQYSLKMIPKAPSHTGDNMKQSLDTRCFIEGQEYLISAKFRLLNSTDLTSGMECIPSNLNVNSPTHCPTITIRGDTCDGNNVEYIFWNADIDQYLWDPHGYNHFEKVFTINSNIASCQNVVIEIGRFLHVGRFLLADEIQIVQRTTLSPTPYPTFSPTKGKTTSPTIRQTEAPTTSNIVACPLVGSPPVILSSGSVMVQVADTNLCTLTKSVTSPQDGEVSLIPIALSYDNNSWERAAGAYATTLFNGEDIICYAVGCQINLPSLEAGAEYQLTSYTHSLEEKDEYARFLETSTFGVTEEDLNEFEASSNNVQENIISWIENQMNSSITPISSHREFYRHGLVPRMPTSVFMGTADHPCDLHSRWRKLSFTRTDLVKNSLTGDMGRIFNVIGNGPFELKMNGWTRTIVQDLIINESGYAGYKFNPNFDYEVCRFADETIGGRFFIQLENGACVSIPNPVINLDGYELDIDNVFNLPNSNLEPIDTYWTDGQELVYFLDEKLFDNPSFSTLCSKLPPVPQFGDKPVFGKLSDGTWLMFDPRLDVKTNTLSSPISDGGLSSQVDSGGVTFCSNTPRTFLNENECKLSSDACQGAYNNNQLEITLVNSTIASINALTERYVYAIKGLLVKYDGIVLGHPCTPGLRSRWETKDIADCIPTALYSDTTASLSKLISESEDNNPYIRDIFFPGEGAFCNPADTEPEIEIKVDGECWKRVHEEHMSVFDMTYWVDKHPGGAFNIQKWSQNNGTVLIYPGLWERNPHGISNWNNNWKKFTYVGRFGDNIKIGDLPNELRTAEVISYFDNTQRDDGGFNLVCGSPGEVSPIKNEDSKFEPYTGFHTFGTDKNANNVWLMTILGASDQLRQRVAWAIAQILIVVEDAVLDEFGYTERYLSFYDIFVRNAFGNYRDILKEISYNPVMAMTLSFIDSKSSGYMLELYKIKTSPDENFSREVMQLFTIGINQLNMDGSPKLDKDGNTIPTYTSNDILSLSRAWTGFSRQPQRGNREGFINLIDPMMIFPEWRDRFPKSDTTAGYIGDTYPACSDFPSKSFLRKGATYRFLARATLPELMTDPLDFALEETVVKVVLNETSSLRSLLCNEDETGNCVYKNSVTLSTNYECVGIECHIDTPRVVEIAENAHYEFVHPPCVNMAFYNNALRVSPIKGSEKVVCADPRLPVASEACCSVGSSEAYRNSKFSGERMKFATAEDRCAEISKEACDYYWIGGEYYLNQGYFWTSVSCELQVKVKKDGTVAIVHAPRTFMDQVQILSPSNENYFMAYWERDSDYPVVDNDCGNVCEVLSEGACLCNTRVIETAIFSKMPSSIAEVMDQLHIGAAHPDMFDSEVYTLVFDDATNITAHLKDNMFGLETIFEFDDDKGRKILLKNCKSSVYLRSTSGGFTGQSFRNAPHFMSFIPSETNVRDAQYETDAVLDHYLYHDNTPPFIALKLIQRLVTSNPRPQYIETVAHAFKSGTYSTGEISFGTGKYGDLASTFAAIYLDKAARNVMLDADMANGSIREPILKVLALMKSMEFGQLSPVIEQSNIFEDIGQMAHEFKSVFSFFDSEYRPAGRIDDASLVSPEATILIMPKILGLLNGLSSLVKFGLSSCDGGWTLLNSPCDERIYIPSKLGTLEFNRTSEVIPFSFETFEGPSLVGGLDNTWFGREFGYHNGKTTLDPYSHENHVLHFPTYSIIGDFYSKIIQNSDSDGNAYVVKFRYLSTKSSSGGCIGYMNGIISTITAYTYVLCDGDVMRSNGNWISCQFKIPDGLESFRIVVGDTRMPGGDAYFDDIQIASGTETGCTGIDVPKRKPPGQVGYSNKIIDRLSTILTAGRLSTEGKSIIVDAFNDAGSAEDGLRIAQQLIVTTAEFHTTDIVKNTGVAREDEAFPKPTGKPYRAVVYLMLSGGCDSYNMLVPYTCSNDLYESYLELRQQVALAKHELFPISAEGQVCSEFGIHPQLPAIKDLYNNEDLLFFANTGVLSQPVNKGNYFTLTKTQLFAHNHMRREAKRLDPYEMSEGTGVLGRMSDVMSQAGYNVGSFSVDEISVALIGKPGAREAPVGVNPNGIGKVYLDETKDFMLKLHNHTAIDSGAFAETWSSSLLKSIGVNELLTNEMEGLSTKTAFPNSELGKAFSTVSRLIATRKARGVDIDTFYIEKKGYDTHASVESQLNNLFSELNGALHAFSEEMKALYIWDNVTVVQTSDFGRTLNPNGGGGTDHAWGGNYMLMGGSVKGGQILGEYPDDFSDEGPQTLVRGRLIPTTPWEAVFRGIASWLGASEDKLDEVCPNLHKFNSSHLIDVNEMYGNIEVPPTPNPTQEPSSVASDAPSASPTVEFSKTPSEIPSLTHSTLPTLLQSESPSSKPSYTPSWSPSKTPSEIPSLTHSTLPTLLPSESPSSEPSFKPSWSPSEIPSTTLSNTPTLLPSQIPTTSGICPVNNVLNSTFHFILPNIACLRAEVFENGKMEADYSDMTCSNEVFNPMDEFSLFDSIGVENNIATFAQGEKLYFGTMRFRLSPDVTETQLKILSWDNVLKQYAVELSVSSCSSIELPPTLSPIAPSTSPSSNPSNVVCGIDQIWNESYKFIVGERCYRLEISENGKLQFDGTDPTCSNPVFNPSATLSVFGSVNTDTKEVFFVAENATQFKGSIRIRQSSSLTNAQVNILSLDGNLKEFVAEIEIPSCA